MLHLRMRVNTTILSMASIASISLYPTAHAWATMLRSTTNEMPPSSDKTCRRDRVRGLLGGVRLKTLNTPNKTCATGLAGDLQRVRE